MTGVVRLLNEDLSIPGFGTGLGRVVLSHASPPPPGGALPSESISAGGRGITDNRQR